MGNIPAMRLRSLAIVGTGVAGAATAGALHLLERRWHATPDPCGPDLGTVPDGEHFKVETSDGAVIAGAVAGDGPDVVLSHCWTGSRLVWGPVARRLVERGHRVVLYDQRGHGDSTIGEEGFSMSRLGADLDDVLSAVDAREAVLAGHSMGGMSVQALAVEHPETLAERSRRIVLLSTACHGIAPQRRFERGSDVVAHPRLDRVMRSRLGMAFTRTALGRNASHAQIRLVRDHFCDTPGAVRAGLLRAMQAMDFREGLTSLDLPTTVVIGRRDTLTPLRLARTLAGAIEGAELIELDDFGHMLPLEAPDVVTDIIAGDPGAGSSEIPGV